MAHALARSLLLMLLVGSALLSAESKTLNRRTDKISENFKQLDLPPEEIDPNVAPPEPQKLDNAVAEAVEETVAEPDDADKNPISRYCKCNESHCDCCRKFGLPLLPSGPGCAKISYLGNDEMSVSLKFGDITLASRRISSKRARPICVGMPGGYSKFCGRVYGLSRAQENFKACLAFELRSEDELEAQLPISCFKFGSEGLRVAEAEPLPTKVKKPEEDDDDDIFGFGAGDDEDEDEDDDYDDGETAASAEDDDADDYTEDDDTEAPEDADYGGFSLGGLLDELDDDEDEKPSKKPAAVAAAAVAAAAAPATRLADQTTREHIEMEAQSKDEAGTVAAAAPAAEASPAAAAVEDAAAAAAAVPAVAAAEDSSATTASATSTKAKKSKKAKKNKKKKKAANTAAAGEGDFAYELLNGILDFFN
ncbi:protein bfr2 [Drosophila hydei]|uniref:Protein bfr2 n=1 Tax=Drosophila hydei TaxID=7224 RepID=A0A6J2SUT0_DROHY|nr:protein bfr2 [Drosophila hydei]